MIFYFELICKKIVSKINFYKNFIFSKFIHNYYGFCIGDLVTDDHSLSCNSGEIGKILHFCTNNFTNRKAAYVRFQYGRVEIVDLIFLQHYIFDKNKHICKYIDFSENKNGLFKGNLIYDYVNNMNSQIVDFLDSHYVIKNLDTGKISFRKFNKIGTFRNSWE